MRGRKLILGYHHVKPDPLICYGGHSHTRRDGEECGTRLLDPISRSYNHSHLKRMMPPIKALSRRADESNKIMIATAQR